MELIYEGKNISGDVEIREVSISDPSGGIADSIDITFNDPDKLWSKWKPEKNQTVHIIADSFNSGVMYVDELMQERGVFIIRALSIPQEAKTSRTKTWENINFSELAKEFAAKYGFELKTYGIQDYIYPFLTQFDQADFEYLATRCLMEGYILKISNQSVIIYDEKYIESQDSVKTVYSENMDGNYKFKKISTGIYSSCKIQYGKITSEYKPAAAPLGPTLKINDIYISSQEEANRYAPNFLRSRNKHEIQGKFVIDFDPAVAAGNMISIQNIGLFDGDYFIDHIVNMVISKKSIIKARGTLEGY